jgi:hypothetical protein
MQRATLAASLLASGACRVGGTNALAPSEIEDGDGDRDLSMSESPAVAGRPDGAAEDPTHRDAAVGAEEPAEDAGERADATAQEADGGTPGCGTDACEQGPLGCTELDWQGHAYWFCDEARSWHRAREGCLAAGVDLAIIDDEQENDFVAQHVTEALWIGASDLQTEGVFRWVSPGSNGTGAALGFSRWASTKPDNCGGGIFGQQDCARVSSDGAWDDSDCAGGCFEGLFGYVCESY